MFTNTDTVLFIDDAAIADTIRLSRVWEKPRKFGPVVTPEHPWEGHCVIVFGSVLERPGGGGYQMWYQSFQRQYQKAPLGFFCYAESDDGVNWVKPSLGIVEVDGSTDNNVVINIPDRKQESLSVIIEEDAPESERYKMLLYRGGGPNGEVHGLYAAYSLDGIHWTEREEAVLPGTGDRTACFVAPEREARYVGLGRQPGMMEEFRARTVSRTESNDFVNWSPMETMLVPDLDDSWDLQFYGMTAFKYRDMYLGQLELLWSTPDICNIELVHSRDTIHWNRTREVFLEAGPEEWDSYWVGPTSSGPIERDGQLYFYYEGRNRSHEKILPFPKASIGLAVLPKDRFCALEAGSVEGIVTTESFTCDGDVTMNVNAHSGGITDHYAYGGYVRAEVLDAEGQPIPGFTYDESERGHGNNAAWEPTWTGGASLESLKGQTISLRIYLVNARLYAISS